MIANKIEYGSCIKLANKAADAYYNSGTPIMSDENYHIILCEVDGKIVSSVSCIVIKNLTRGLRPYALVENVVTDEKYRGRGYASACLEYAYNISKDAGCYKIFLMTGSKNESTLNFYKRAGYNDTDKTAFIRWIE